MPVKRSTQQQVGFTGARWQLHGQRDPNTATWLNNLVPREHTVPSSLIHRPAIYAVNSITGATGAVQAITETYFGGTSPVIVALIAGQIWTKTAAGAWTLRVTTANFTTATISIVNTTYWLHVVEYNGELVFTDNTNQAWSWDGTAGAGGLTLLTNTPATTVGAPTVYYGKLFFIKSGNTIVWSEENAANTGYEATGYNNAWDLKQTDDAPIRAILGTEGALYFWRPTSIGYVTGSVTPDFASTGVQDGVSTQVGISSAWSLSWDGTTAYFADQRGKPWAMRDRQLIPLWEQIAPIWSDQRVLFDDDDDHVAAVVANAPVYPAFTRSIIHPVSGHVLFLFPVTASGTVLTGVGTATYGCAFAFSTTTLQWHGMWSWGDATINNLGVATEYASATQVYPGLVVAATGASPAKVVYWNARLLSGGLVDNVTAAANYSTARLISGPLNWGPLWKVNCDQVHVVYAGPQITGANYSTRLKVRALSPDVASDALAPTYLSQTFTASGTYLEESRAFGVSQSGRWIMVDVEIATLLNGNLNALQDTELIGVAAELSDPTLETARR